MVAEFGRLPEVGESVVIDGWTFLVSGADDRRLHAMEVLEGGSGDGPEEVAPNP